ncbi:protein trachealess-like [Schistocerca serialis cubense]|uniref:protein trachealess-like n=1 Tax=Schistocerca serialis cubense TaxID=2023355 RepID=UPI00214F5ADF|nr:protein trachealess-like [Schistocerca serialis cubense]
MLPYQAVAMDYAVTSSFQRQPGSGALINPAFTHSCILEVRKEKSRDAARIRRGKENFEFYELAKMLPLPAAITSQLDKASIIRLTISYLKLRDFSGHGDPPWSRDGPPPNKSVKGPVRPRSVAGIAMEMFEQHQGTHILQSLDGFAFALAADARFLYISETVSIYLGLSQVEMTGSSIFEYIHQQDHAELAEQLGLGLAQGQSLASPGSAGSEEGAPQGTNNPDVATQMSLSSSSAYKGLDRAFCVRMKSTLTKRGCHFKSSGYRVVLVLSRLRPQYTFSHARKSSPPLLGMVAIAMALPPPSVHEIRLESDMFVTRINFDFRIAHCEPRVSELLDYTADELTGKNLYTLCHGEDANKLRKSHLDLINKGQVMTQYYRLMNKSGGYTWVQTCATVVCNSKNADEQNIICVNYIISGREYENVVMDCCQMDDAVPQTVKREDNDPENPSPDADRPGGRSSGAGAASQQQPPQQPQPEPHRSPPDLEEGSSQGAAGAGAGAGAGEPHGRRLAAPAPGPSQLGGGLSIRALKKLAATRGRPHKRKLLSDEDSSCCSSDEDDEDDEDSSAAAAAAAAAASVAASAAAAVAMAAAAAKRAAVLSPASSSCHSSSAAAALPSDHSPKPDDPDGQPGPPGGGGAGGGGTSVKDLEHAMSKHLPAATPPQQQQQQQPTDFSTDALLKQQQQQQQQRSTIQWIGAHHLGPHGAHQATAAGPLPASALLRQLYANRESVIRANVHAAAAARGSSAYYTADQAAASSAAAATAYDYHSAMTPPSSVSPRDKHQQQLFDGYQYELPAQPLPLKPQVYSAVHPSALDAAYSSLDQAQFYHHHGAAQAFHLYHPAANKTVTATATVYPEALKNSANWYSTTS